MEGSRNLFAPKPSLEARIVKVRAVHELPVSSQTPDNYYALILESDEVFCFPESMKEKLDRLGKGSSVIVIIEGNYPRFLYGPLEEEYILQS